MTLEQAWEESKKRARVLAILGAVGEHRTKPYRVDPLYTECMLRGYDGRLAESYVREASDIGLACIVKPLGRN